MEPLDPKEALNMLEEESVPDPNTEPPQHNGERASKEAKLLGSTREAIALRRAEIEGTIKLERNRQRMEIAKIKATTTGREAAKKNLAQYSGVYLTILCALFLIGTQYLSGESLAVVASVISIVIVNLTGIMKDVVSADEPEDPTTLMHDIVQKQLDKDHDKKK